MFRLVVLRHMCKKNVGNEFVHYSGVHLPILPVAGVGDVSFSTSNSSTSSATSGSVCFCSGAIILPVRAWINTYVALQLSWQSFMVVW